MKLIYLREMLDHMAKAMNDSDEMLEFEDAGHLSVSFLFTDDRAHFEEVYNYVFDHLNEWAPDITPRRRKYVTETNTGFWLIYKDVKFCFVNFTPTKPKRKSDIPKYAENKA